MQRLPSVGEGCCPTPAAGSRPGEDRALADDAAGFYEALSDLIRSYRLRNMEETCSFGITLTECYGLEALVRKGPITLNQFADALALDKSTASRAAISLEQKRLARRRPHAIDGRAIQLQATRKGRALYESIRRCGVECHARLLARFDPATRRAATSLLREVHRASRPAADPARRTA